MPRRKSPEKDVIDIAQAGGAFAFLVILLAILQPRLFSALIWAFIIVVVTVLFALTGIAIRKAARNRARQSEVRVMRPIVDLHELTRPASVSGPKANEVKSFVASGALTPVPITEQDLRAIDWFQFEQIMAALYELQGCRIERRGGANPDGGIDLVIYENSQRIAVQCKHWKVWKVGVRHLREFFGGMKAEGFDQGVFATIKGCTNEAREFACAHQITILGGSDIQRMLTKAEAHTCPNIQAILKDKTKHCPKCGAPMFIRTARHSLNPGSQFWGCSTYPRCKGVIRLED
jgi:hypothetical protein